MTSKESAEVRAMLAEIAALADDENQTYREKLAVMLPMVLISAMGYRLEEIGRLCARYDAKYGGETPEIRQDS